MIVDGEIGELGLNAQKLVAEVLDKVLERSKQKLRMVEFLVPEAPLELLRVIRKAALVMKLQDYKVYFQWIVFDMSA